MLEETAGGVTRVRRGARKSARLARGGALEPDLVAIQCHIEEYGNRLSLPDRYAVFAALTNSMLEGQQPTPEETARCSSSSPPTRSPSSNTKRASLTDSAHSTNRARSDRLGVTMRYLTEQPRSRQPCRIGQRDPRRAGTYFASPSGDYGDTQPRRCGLERSALRSRISTPFDANTNHRWASISDASSTRRTSYRAAQQHHCHSSLLIQRSFVDPAPDVVRAHHESEGERRR